MAFNLRCRALGIAPQQIPEEIHQLAKIVAELDCKRMLEIGTAQGGTLYLFSRVVNPDAVLISVDLPGGAFGGGYPAWKVPFYRSFASRNQKIHLLREDSHDSKTLEKVKGLVDGKPLDFLFIDADHTYEGVKKDFEMYAPLVRPGGLVAFHDIAPHPAELKVEVPQFCKEIKSHYGHQEIVKSWDQDGYGIGILRMEEK